jgi:hypothetical protein
MRTRTTLPIAALLWLGVGTSPVAADCDLASFEETLTTAPVAFVGTVTALDGPVATFKVLEVWRGDVDETVQVRGSLDQAGAFAEDDRQWQAATTYLVFPIVDGAVLRDTICTATNEWTPEFAQFRPADARLLDGGDTGPPVLAIGLGVLIGAIVVVSALLFRRG